MPGRNWPVIGLVEIGTDTWERRYFRQRYFFAIENMKAKVKLLPHVTTQEEATRQLSKCDGLLLPGGPDLDLAPYGMVNQPYNMIAAPARDLCEPLYLTAAMNRQLPVLGICRGCQLINVFLGGTLYQDLIKEAPPSQVDHRQKMPYQKPIHEVILTKDSLLTEITGEEKLKVNSMHHQAIFQVAPDLIVEAQSPDQLAEAVVYKNTEWMVGVQWHPEWLVRCQKGSARIFEAFRQEAYSYHNR